ncbi:MAG: DUF721 domain-containing protein [Bacteroidetes bacterium]|nr:MAG: DUF721 domain-containing protein [Bacteroidota bacterium]
MKTSSPKPFSSILETVIQNLGIGGKLKKAEAMDKWAEVVGEQIGRVTAPVRIEGETLVVHVTSSAWRNELVFLKKELITKVNNSVGQEIIKEIIFR